MTGDIEVPSGVLGDPLSDRRLLDELAGRFLIWDAFVGGARRVELHPIVLPAALHAAAVDAAEAVARAVGRAAERAFHDEEERARYGFDPDTERLAAASYRAGDDAALVRVDLLLGSDGVFRACEINADCPGGHNEAFGLPRLARAAGFRQAYNPTDVLERLTERLARLATRDGATPDGRVALVYATAYAEDLQVCALVQRALAHRHVESVRCPPTAPRLVGNELRVTGRTVTALYRFFPTEYMEGQRNAAEIAAAVETGAVRTLSSFACMYAQSKLSFARARALRGALAPEDAAAIERHLPETHDFADLRPGLLIGERASWVVKKALGRVGDEVFVGALFADDEWRVVVNEVVARRAAGERWVAQRFVPQRPIATPWGDRLLTLGAYVLDGRFAGYFARVTPASHVSHDALVLPVFAERAT